MTERYIIDGETPYIVDTKMHKTYSTKSNQFPQDMVELLNEKHKDNTQLKKMNEEYKILIDEFRALCRKVEHGNEINCEDCINCKNTVYPEYNYCELYNDYFSKEDKGQICPEFEEDDGK